MSGNFKPLFGTPLDRTHPLARGLVGCWLLNENTGKYCWDATGNGNDGICTGMADPSSSTSGWGPGPDGGVLLFDGTNDYIDIVASQPINFTQADNYSGAIWFKTSSASLKTLMEKGSGSEATPIDFLINTAHKLQFGTYDGVHFAHNVQSPNTVDDGVWHQGAFVHLSTGTYTGYLDGVSIGSNTDEGNFSNTSNLTIGTALVLSRFFPGQLDAPMLYNRALSAEEIAYLYTFPHCMFEDESYPAWMIAQFKADWLVRARRIGRR